MSDEPFAPPPQKKTRAYRDSLTIGTILEKIKW